MKDSCDTPRGDIMVFVRSGAWTGAVTVNNMTRDEAQGRARLLSVSGYAVALDLTTGATTFRSRTSVSFSCAEPGAGSYLDLTAEAVHEVVLNGVSLSEAEIGKVFDGNRIQLTDLASDNELLVVADCGYMNTGEGLHRFVDPVDKSVYLYTQFETFDAHRMYACFDQPDLKATFTFTVTAPADWLVVTNMSAASVSDATSAGVRTHEFAVTQRMSTYITALVAGPYYSVFDTYTSADGTTIPLGLFCRSSLAEFLDADSLFEVTKQGFDFFHGLFDFPYPFGKYDQLFVPEFNAGAMENAGAVTFLEDYVFRSKVTDYAYERRAETVLHEMAHMWFGDLVTMRWWDDLWLNESFATYASVLCQSEATRWTTAWTTFANVEKTWAYRQDQLPSTHPIASDIVDIEAVKVNFDGITYAKGASVLKQLVAYVGREAFFSAIRGYFAAYAWGNTTLQDLLQELEQASGRDLAAWSAEWLETAGVNTLRPQFEVRADGTFGAFAVLQEAPADHPTLRSHRVGVGLYDRVDGRLVRRRTVEIDVVGARTEVPAARRRGPARRRPGQRRRPDLRQDPSRRGVAGDDHDRHRHVRGLAAPRPVLERGVGHDPRRRDGRERLPDAGAVGHLERSRHRRGHRAAAPGPGSADLLHGTGARRRRLEPPGRCRECCHVCRRAGQRPAAGLGPHPRLRRP